MSPVSAKISIFEYDDYRKFLKEFYLAAKSENKNFTYRYFSRICGFKSSNFLYLLMSGKSNISLESIVKLAKAIKFNKEETAFFKNLVLFNQAGTSEERLRYSKELIRSKTYRKLHPLNQFQYHYFDQWYFPVVRGLVALKGFKEDPEWIAKKINPPITELEAKRALDELSKLGLLTRDSDGRLTQATMNITTSDAITSSSLAHYHREMAKKASESIDSVPREKLDLSAMTLQVSAETTKKIKEMAEKFRTDVIEVVSRESAPDKLYQMNFYIFPVAEIEGEEES